MTFLCTCSRLSTSAKKTPTENNMAPRISRLVVLEWSATGEGGEHRKSSLGQSSADPRTSPQISYDLVLHLNMFPLW